MIIKGVKTKYCKRKISNVMKINDFLFKLTLLFLPILTTLVIEIIHRGSLKDFLIWLTNNGFLFFYTVLIIFAISNSLAILIKSKRFIIILNLTISFVLLILTYISNLKINLRGEPLSILDYRLISEALGVIDGFNLNLWLPIILTISFSSIIIIVFLKVKGEIKFLYSLVCSVLSLIILVFILILEIEDFGKIGISVPADISFNHEANGFIIANVIDSKFLTIPKPENYSEEKIMDIINEMETYQLKTSIDTEFEEPNIIFIMSESFSDPSKLMGLKTNQEVIPNFKKYAINNVSGTLSVPGIGGGTANTEFEVLTGFSKDNIPNYSAPYNPYNTYITDSVDSLAAEFSQQDYETLAVHTYHSWFYRRNLVYKNLGFKQFLPIEFINDDKYVGEFIDDQVINNVIIEQVNKTKNKDFIYAVTMASHGPYDEELPKEIILEENVVNKDEIENYLNAIHVSDQRLGELITYFENYEEPTIIIFFGDHIPPLGNDFYNNVGVEMGSEVSKEAPLLIWSNYKKNEPSTISLEADLLGAWLLEEIGYHKNPYFTYLSQRLDNDEVDNDFIDNVYNYQYDSLHGKQYISKVKAPYKNEKYTLGYDFQINDIIAREDNDVTALQISGENLHSNLTLKILKSEYPIHSESQTKGYVYIPNNILKDSKELRLIIKDSRETIIKESNSFNLSKLTYLDTNGTFENWYSADLNGDQYWEIFYIGKEYIIVRLQLPEHYLMGIRPYYVTKDGKILPDKNADLIDAAFFSDIYENGYLYLSIPNLKELQHNDHDDIESIKKYFSKENYVLNTLY